MAPGPLARIAAELYALAPEDFTAARDAEAKRARADGDRDLADEVKALRRPPVAAWLANTLARAAADEVDALLALGAQLREAQDALDGAALRTMTRQRQEVVRGLSATARSLAGRDVPDAAVRDLEATLDAALADEAAAQALRSGRLMRPLASTGLEPVDLSGAVAAPQELPPPTTRTRATARLPRKQAAAHGSATGKSKGTTAASRKSAASKQPPDRVAKQRSQDLARAEDALGAAAGELEAADAKLREARASVAAIDAELADLQTRLDDAGSRRVAAEHARRDADTARKAAIRARDAAQRAVRTAQKRVP